MARDDYAIIVGVSIYPGIGDLVAPETDARAFYDWVISPDGGAVPKKHTKLIITSKFKPPFLNASVAKPTAQQVVEAMEELEDLAIQNNDRGKDLRAGRRLYLYFAGHGFARTKEYTALLTANATRDRTGPPYHIVGEYSAGRFWESCYFDEVVLLMDCCRDEYTIPSVNLTSSPVRCDNAVGRTRYFYGFASQWSRSARERPMRDGVTRGVFTTALLEGLRGAAVDAKGSITADSLKGYLYRNMKTFLGPEDLEDPEVAKEPGLDTEPKVGDGIIFKTGLPPKFPVEIKLPPRSKGKRIQILRGQGLKQVASRIAQKSVWRIQLERGTYLIQIGDLQLQAVIEVTGEGVNYEEFEKIG